ncbi:HsdR-like protein of type I restriction modification system [Scardovia inopinata]|nr:HsdR-like protein of type I restriction modification system [Scardovia inopinata]
MIHIEEKWDKHDALEGLYQIQQYIDEGVFTGIYSTTQILVGLTPHESRYMANTDSEHFNTDFAFRWQRKEDSKPVWDWREFCDKMLSIQWLIEWPHSI